MKRVLILALVAASFPALAALANFTGRMEFRQTVTGQQAVACEFQYGMQKFWKLFPMGSSCPPTIEVM